MHIVDFVNHLDLGIVITSSEGTQLTNESKIETKSFPNVYAVTACILMLSGQISDQPCITLERIRTTDIMISSLMQLSSATDTCTPDDNTNKKIKPIIGVTSDGKLKNPIRNRKFKTKVTAKMTYIKSHIFSETDTMIIIIIIPFTIYQSMLTKFHQMTLSTLHM